MTTEECIKLLEDILDKYEESNDCAVAGLEFFSIENVHNGFKESYIWNGQKLTKQTHENRNKI